MNVLANLKYTKDHEWVRVEGDLSVVGITDYAQSQLGDIVFVDVQTEGDVLLQGEEFGAIEAVKTVASAYMPLSGEIVEFNTGLESAPELINKDPYGDGWIVKIKMNKPSELDDLLDAEAYQALLQ